jgi:pre-mRNA cleavage complex 2 protein Pcf11
MAATMMQKDLESEDAARYSETLDELKFNSRPHIITLTELARDYGRSIPHVIVKIIETRIFKASTSCKLPTLYLMDSIIKNHPNPYKPLFGRNLGLVFVHVFDKSKEDIRSQLFKLRNTWTPLYSREILHEFDFKVRKIDPAWPLSAKSESGPTIHVNPHFLGKQKAVEKPAPSAELSKDDELIKMQEELRQLKKKKLAMELQALKEELKQSEEKGPVVASKSGSSSKESGSTSKTSSSSGSRSSGSSSKESSSMSQKVCMMVLVS